jgi:hypothetical protein
MSMIEDVVKGVVSPLATPMEIIKDVIGKFSSGKDKLDAELALAKIAQEKAETETQLALAQVEINKKEAESNSIFTSGGRSFIMWICGAALGLYYIPQFIIATILWIILFIKTGNLQPYPINPDSLFQLVYSLLGFGAYHTAEKITKIINSK